MSSPIRYQHRDEGMEIELFGATLFLSAQVFADQAAWEVAQAKLEHDAAEFTKAGLDAAAQKLLRNAPRAPVIVELAKQLSTHAKRPRRPNGKVPEQLVRAAKKVIKNKGIFDYISCIASMIHTPGKLSNWCQLIEIEINCWSGKARGKKEAFTPRRMCSWRDMVPDAELKQRCGSVN